MNPTILLTGAAGMIGRYLVPYLLTHSDADLVLLVHQRGRELSAGDFLRHYHGLPPTPRVRLLPGDLARPNLGLAFEERRRLQRSVTHILHAAALTRFDLAWPEAEAVNMTGTQRLAGLAQECERLEQFGYVSTAYVSGRRTGLIREDELDRESGFVNTYEQSKYQAERFLAEVGGRLPASVYRLSTVLGDSRTGEVCNMTAPHHALRAMYLGLASLMPGSADYRVDLIPGDFAAAVLGRLFLDHFRPGETFHLTACPEKTCTLAELVELVYERFAEFDPEWGRRRYPRPLLSSPEAFELFARSIEQAGNPILAEVFRTVRTFAHQLLYPKSFDRTNLLRAMPGYDHELPDVRRYYGKVIRFCLQTQWGKHAA